MNSGENKGWKRVAAGGLGFVIGGVIGFLIGILIATSVIDSLPYEESPSFMVGGMALALVFALVEIGSTITGGVIGLVIFLWRSYRID